MRYVSCAVEGGGGVLTECDGCCLFDQYIRSHLSKLLPYSSLSISQEKVCIFFYVKSVEKMVIRYDIGYDDPAIIAFGLRANRVDPDDPAIIAFSRMWIFSNENRVNVNAEDSEEESMEDMALLASMSEEDIELSLLRRIEPFVFCQYCGQYPADFKCYDCYRMNYCSVECADSDYQDHAEDCARLQLSRSDLFCRG